MRLVYMALKSISSDQVILLFTPGNKGPLVIRMRIFDGYFPLKTIVSFLFVRHATDNTAFEKTVCEAVSLLFRSKIVCWFE